MSPRPSSSWVRRLCLALCLALYLVLGLRTGRVFFSWDEETMVQPGPALTLLSPTLTHSGAAQVGDSCQTSGGLRTLWLADRPHWNLCYAGRSWPVMIAGYLGGVLYWPLGALGALLGDDLLRRRALSTVLGLVALLAGVRLAREVEGEDAVLPTALALATTPAFVLVHALMLHYETLPSTLLLLAGLVFARGVRGGRQLDPASLRAIAVLIGFSLLANLRFSLMLVAIGLTAWRLRAPVRGLRPRHWAEALGLLLLAMAPTLLYPLLSPPGMQGDRMRSLPVALAHNLTDPSVFLHTGYDLLRWWSNFVDYLSILRGTTRFSVPAFVIAAAALGWVTWEGLRALWRREGSPLAAMLALSLLGFWSTSALIYSTYPRNLAPLHAVFGMSLGLALTRLAGALRHRISGPARLGLCALLTLPFVDSIEQIARASHTSRWPANLVTERAVTDWLVAHPLPGSRLVVFHPQLDGVIEGLSAGALRPVHAAPLFWPCEQSETSCLTRRMNALLRWNGDRPMRLVLVAPEPHRPPGDPSPTYEVMRSVVRAAGGQPMDEFHAWTPMGTDGMLVMQVVPSAQVVRGGASGSAASRAARHVPPLPDFNPDHYADVAMPPPGALGGPRTDLSREEITRFELGRRAFTTAFTPRTGLGPYYEETSCAACHFNPTVGGTTTGRLLVVGPGPAPDYETLHYPAHVIPGFPPRVPPADATRSRPRPLFGLGLIDDVPASVIIAGCDPDDRDHDGVRGRAHIFRGRLSRFGSKAHEYTVRDFAQNALYDDMNLTSGESDFFGVDHDLHPDPEVPDAFLDQLADYVRGLAPPPRAGEHPEGEAVFTRIGCAACHRADLAPMARGAYTDLCLHDMGPALDNHVVVDKDARGRDWRTPPLWGLRFQPMLLHDGRATTPDEAVRAHGGEGAPARDRYLALPEAERAQLLAFLRTL